MVPASVYLGFSASIIWVGQVKFHASDFYVSLYITPIVCSARRSFLTFIWPIRVRISLPLPAVMQKIATYMKGQ